MNQTTNKNITKQIKRKAVALKEEEEEKQLIKVIEHAIYKPKVSIQFADTCPWLWNWILKNISNV